MLAVKRAFDPQGPAQSGQGDPHAEPLRRIRKDAGARRPDLRIRTCRGIDRNLVFQTSAGTVVDQILVGLLVFLFRLLGQRCMSPWGFGWLVHCSSYARSRLIRLTRYISRRYRPKGSTAVQALQYKGLQQRPLLLGWKRAHRALPARRCRGALRLRLGFMRILLVEDDTILADALCRALVQSAYAVDVVANGEQADNALAIESYDLAILDIGLPGLSGLDVLRRLRARRSACAGAAADRARRAGRPGARPRPGRGRLPGQAFRPARTRGAGSRAAAPGRRHSTPFLQHGRLRLDTVGRRRVLRRPAGRTLRTRAGGARVAADARGPGGQQGAHGQPPVRVGRRGRRQCDRGLRLPHPQEARAPGMRDPHRPRAWAT